MHDMKIFHLYYTIAIFTIIIIGLISIELCSDGEAFSCFSFAATLVSIVLAVVSIFFTVVSSQKMNTSYNNLKELKTDIKDEVSRFSNKESWGSRFDSDIEVFVGHDSVNVSELMKNARQYIFLHAAYYPKYGVDAQGEIIKQALKQNSQLKLSVTFSADTQSWIEEFAQILRPHFSEADYKNACNNSKVLFDSLQNLFGKERVMINNTDKLPMFPIIMIDDYLIIGFYSHSKIIAPHGLWLKIKNKNVMTMYEKLKLHGNDNLDISQWTDEEKAIFRFVEEIYNAQQ